MSTIKPLLAKYATTHLGRPIAVGDPEVRDFEEALRREAFRQGGRVNLKGYFLDVIMLGIPALDANNRSSGIRKRVRCATPNPLF